MRPEPHVQVVANDTWLHPYATPIGITRDYPIKMTTDIKDYSVAHHLPCQGRAGATWNDTHAVLRGKRHNYPNISVTLGERDAERQFLVFRCVSRIKDSCSLIDMQFSFNLRGKVK